MDSCEHTYIGNFPVQLKLETTNIISKILIYFVAKAFAALYRIFIFSGMRKFCKDSKFGT